METKKLLYPLLAAVAFGAALYLLATRPEEDSAKLAFSIHAETFRDALVYARSNALAVEFGPEKWAVLQDGKTVKQGAWKGGERLGSNIEGGRFWFDKSGACLTAGGDCSGFEMAVAADVQRIYTITFDNSGMPVFEYDDF